MLTQIFTTDDTAVYCAWQKDGTVILYVPGIGAIQMTLAKAEELAADMARQAEFGRWDAIEKRHDESQEKPSI